MDRQHRVGVCDFDYNSSLDLAFIEIGDATASGSCWDRSCHRAGKVRLFPAVLSRDPRLLELVSQPRNQALNTQVNETLSLWAKTASVEHIFLLNNEGTTLAASNWQSDLSFVGRNYGFRPYFKEAINNGSATFFAIGATTKKPGYFLGSAVADTKGRHVGVLVVKIEPNDLAAQISELSRNWLVVDDLGFSILSNDETLLYRIWTLREGQIETAKAQARYQPQPSAFQQAERLAMVSWGGDNLRLDRRAFYAQSQVEGEPWQLISLVTMS